MTNSSDLNTSCTDLNTVDLGFVELSWLQIAVLGVVQGITELLPISSTAHLRVIPGILGWRDPGSAFSAAMQLASFVAVVVYSGRISAPWEPPRYVRPARVIIDREIFACSSGLCWERFHCCSSELCCGRHSTAATRRCVACS